jgi:pSer/pThr/pTyr-binding forkhead associated (FHA) protein
MVTRMTQHSLELFRTSCGMTGTLELRIARQGEPLVRRHVFNQPFVLLGSHPANDLCVRDTVIKARHAFLQVIQGSLFCFDLGSRTGLRWGQRVQPYGWLTPGRCLHTGPYLLWLAESDEGADSFSDRRVPLDPLREEMFPGPSRPGFVLEARQRDGRARRVCGTQLLTLIGRSPGCTPQLDHPSVSWFHCGVLNTPDGPWALDLLSREGTLVNGERRRWARLNDGDELRVGNCSLRLHYEPPAAPVPGGEAGRGLKTEDRGPRAEDRGELLSVSGPPSSVLGPRPCHDTGAADTQPGREGHSLLLPVIQQFSLMQQQMFDQFHQSMTMLVEMFGALHREQNDLIRAELDQLHELTRELQTLQAELIKQPPQRGPERPGVPSARNLPASRERARKPADEANQDGGHSSTPAERQIPTEAPPSAGTPEKAPLPEGVAGENIHAWLSHRIATLQQERQTRWQKVMQFMLGR